MKNDFYYITRHIADPCDVRNEVDKIFLAEAVNEALATLPERLRKALMARYDEGLTFQEIANRFNVSRERIRQLCVKASRLLLYPQRLNIIKRLEIPEINKIFEAHEIRRKERIKAEQDRFDLIYKEHRERREREAQNYRKSVEWRELWEFERWLKEDYQERERDKRRKEKEEWQHQHRVRVHQVIPIHTKCPDFVTLRGQKDNYYLVCDTRYGTIDRSRDPETYDKWLNELIAKKKGDK